MNEVFAVVDIFGLSTGVTTIVVGLISVTLILVGYFWVLRAINPESRYTLWKKDNDGEWYFDVSGDPRKKGFWE